MSYIQDTMGQGEKLVARAYFHWWYSLKAWSALVGLTLLGIALFFALFRQSVLMGALLGALSIASGSVFFIRMMVRRWKTEIAVTTHRFVEKEGLFTLNTSEVALGNIEGVRVTQGPWGQLLGYGRLRIEGTGVDHIDLPDIADPLAFRAAIETAKSMGH